MPHEKGCLELPLQGGDPVTDRAGRYPELITGRLEALEPLGGFEHSQCIEGWQATHRASPDNFQPSVSPSRQTSSAGSNA